MKIIDAAVVGHEMHKTEALYDETLMSSAKLLQELLKVRQHPTISPATGQDAIARLVRSQQRLVESQGDILRVHGQIADIARERADVDTGQCPWEQTGALADITETVPA